jgi:glutamyl-tRNA reductase
MVMPTWQLVVCGANHKTSELKEREPLQINRDDLAEANATLGRLPDVMESLILSTCNRVEFYVVSQRSREPFDILSDFYHQFKGIDIRPLSDKFFVRKGSHAADHLFRVASGIESVVLGENEILGQMREAYSSSCSIKSAGKLIHRLFHQAFRIGKLVRTNTEMSKGACSVAGAAVALLKSRLDKEARPSVLFIGVNRMIKLAASNFSRLHHGNLLFANRTAEKAIEFSAQFGGSGHSLDELPELLLRADMVVTCTGSQEPIINRDMLQTAIDARDGKQLTIMDMAIPRDVESDGVVGSVTLFDLETIKAFIADRQERARKAVPHAEEIIDRKLSEFTYWYKHLQHEPMYNGVGDSFEKLRQEELGPLLKTMPPDMQYALDKASRRLINRLMQIKVRSKS